MQENDRKVAKAQHPAPDVACGRGGAGATVGSGHDEGMSTGQIITGVVIFGAIMLITLGIMLYGVFTEDRRR